MKKILGSALIATVGINTVDATQGVDVSALVNNWSCLKQAGYGFAIPRGYCSYGGVDRNINANINNAHAAGFQFVDLYMFPCRGKSAVSQVAELVGSVGSSATKEFDVITNETEESAKGVDAGDYPEPIGDGMIGEESNEEHMKWRLASGVQDHQL